MCCINLVIRWQVNPTIMCCAVQSFMEQSDQNWGAQHAKKWKWLHEQPRSPGERSAHDGMRVCWDPSKGTYGSVADKKGIKSCCYTWNGGEETFVVFIGLPQPTILTGIDEIGGNSGRFFVRSGFPILISVLKGLKVDQSMIDLYNR